MNGLTYLRFMILAGEKGLAALLCDAQVHPEKYENLQVRVCGWNVRWNDIPRSEQNAFIARAESLDRQRASRDAFR